jgi:two-component system nitrate/nitrite response regulator NarL
MTPSFAWSLQNIMAHPISLPETSQSIRVLAADGTRMNSQMLVNALARDKRFILLESELTAAAILAAVETQKPDVILLSAKLEDNSGVGFQVARQLVSVNPKICVVMLLDAPEHSSVVEAFRNGARGVFCRTESLKSLSKCIRCVHAGQVWANSRELRYLLDALSQAMSTRLVGTVGASLSKREREVVQCVAEGLSNREIAHRLSLTEHTVKNYLFRIFDKLGVSSRVEVVLYAFNLGRSFSPSAPSGATAPAISKRRTLSAQSARRPERAQEDPAPEAESG